ncbi:hypothetical protein [Hyalangium minutum]|uniref:Outer membrane protein beta-barrel domain-containing protein n=1 Tax=Hyalangium minutum TaxID=394096 RepID=A0A085W033_9BACT|nr:hypothetical protein [Hyalangium minutum]KFE61046.1 hypothetical protein DB31_4481 [Hyalangium minutum]
MRAFLSPLLLMLGLAGPALAQAPSGPSAANSAPDESWLSYPGPEAPAPPPEPLPPPLPVRTSGGRVTQSRPPPEPLKPNRVSLYGGGVLEPGRVGAGLMLGFPLASARVSVGVLPRLDAGIGVDSLYGIMNEVRGYARFELVQGEEAHLAVSVEGGHAFFLSTPSQEEFGARYFTGRRNWNVAPGLVGSLPLGVRTRGFLDVRYLLAFDTQPFQRTPLGGRPEGVQVSGNFLFRAGLEVPFSERTSYIVMVGANIQGREEDAAFMPAVGVGVVTGF